MKATLIAATQIDTEALRRIGYEPHPYTRDEDDDTFGDYDADELAEFAGRNCYLSFSRPNPATYENEDYLANIIKLAHESVFEHATATFYIETSRSVLTELERHRHLSFSVVSQRYVDPTTLSYHLPPAGAHYGREVEGQVEAILADVSEFTGQAYEAMVEILTEQGAGRKQAREAARSVIPNMTNSPMVVTGNHRTWKNIIRQRWHVAADAEIQELAGELLRQLRELAPNTYQDIPTTPYGS